MLRVLHLSPRCLLGNKLYNRKHLNTDKHGLCELILPVVTSPSCYLLFTFIKIKQKHRFTKNVVMRVCQFKIF